MPTYVFKGRNKLNEIVVGERVADNREALRQFSAASKSRLRPSKKKDARSAFPSLVGRKKVKV